MEGTNQRSPWYVAGLAFECAQCGRCCAGPAEGYVWVSDEEITQIADALGIPAEQMRSRYVRRALRKQTIVEDPGTHDCVFLSKSRPGTTESPAMPVGAEQASRGCMIYAVRPKQCRTWPFWQRNLSSPEAWAMAGARCRGINRGRKFTYDEIKQRCDPAV